MEGLENELRSNYATATVAKAGVGSDPLRVVETCVRKRDEHAGTDKAYDTCVVLVDVDTHHRLPQAVKRAAQEGIVMIITNLKFEVWLRWHYEQGRSELGTDQLDRLMAHYKVFQRKKTLSPRFRYASVAQAVATAKLADPDLADGRKGPNPSSAMPLLVEIIKNG